MHITQLATVVVPVSDQDEALAFYVGVLGMRKVSDFTYESGERWVEVAPPGSSTNRSLVVARPERPAGVETGVAMISADVLADLATLRAKGVEVDQSPLPDRGTATAAARTDRRAAAIACEERPPGATRLLLLVCLEAVARPHLAAGARPAPGDRLGAVQDPYRAPEAHPAPVCVAALQR